MSWLNYPAERERAQSSRVNTARNSRNGPGVLLGLQASLELIDTGEVWMESHLHLITAVVATLTQRRKASKSGRAILTYQVTPSKIQLITRAHQIPCPCYAMFDFVTSEMGATRAELSLCQYPVWSAIHANWSTLDTFRWGSKRGIKYELLSCSAVHFEEGEVLTACF